MVFCLGTYPFFRLRRLLVSPLRRVTLEKPQSNQRALAPFVRCLANARHALAPVLLRGPAAIGHPCRVAHCAEPPLGLSRGRLPPPQPRRPESRPGSLVRAFPHSGYVHLSPVGAGLLAMASVQPIHTLTDPPLSPASRLLQGIVFIQTPTHFPCRSQLAGDGRQR